MTRRNWWPCRVCGAEHHNPMSSSLCAPCGVATRDAREAEESAEREAYDASPFGQFMSLSEDERWRDVFKRLAALEAGE